MKKSRGITTLALATGLVAGLAQADTTTASVASSEAVAPKLLDKISVNATSVVYGPSVADPLSSMQPNAKTGKDAAPLLTKNFLSANYKLSDSMRIGPTFYFRWQPVREQKVSIHDPFVRLAHNKLFNSGDFNLAGNVRLTAPVSEVSQQNKLLTHVRSDQMTTYSIPNSRLTAGLSTNVAANIHSKRVNQAKEGEDPSYQPLMELYVGPNLEYRLLPNLSATLLYEMGASNRIGKKFTSFQSDGTDLEPGLSWDITPKLNFSPFLDFKTGNRIAADTTTLGAVVVWNML